MDRNALQTGATTEVGALAQFILQIFTEDLRKNVFQRTCTFELSANEHKRKGLAFSIAFGRTRATPMAPNECKVSLSVFQGTCHVATLQKTTDVEGILILMKKQIFSLALAAVTLSTAPATIPLKHLWAKM